MECGDKSPLSKAVPRHRIPKNGVFMGWCPPLNTVWEMASPPTAARHDMKASASTSNCGSPVN